MKETSLESTLERMEAPAPTRQARANARDAALAEFARVQAANQDVVESERGTTQGFWSALRLSRADQSHGSTSMNWFGGRTLFGGIASACVVTLGIVMVWPIFTRRDAQFAIRNEPAPIEIVRGLMAEPKAKPEPPVVRQPANALPPVDSDTRDARPSVGEKLGGTDKQKKDGRVRIKIESRGDAAAASATPAKEGDQFTVAGSRQSLTKSGELKRNANGVTDAIATSDIETYSPASPVVAGAAPSGNVSKIVAFNGAIAMPVQREPGGSATQDEGRDKFQHFDINPVKAVADEPVSTFSVDVDTASYSFARRMLNAGVLPQKDAVRVEEMINYFDYAWPVPDSRKEPFEPTIIVSDSPWSAGKKLLHIGIKGYELPREKAPDVNLVLLLDVSGSMSSADKLPLAIQSMELLLSTLRPTDTVGIVVYAGQAGLVLEPTPVKDKPKILDALRSLRPGGSTAGAEGIELAYQLAESHFRKGGVNRILLATDGDFNVGIDGTEPLKGFVERKREKGIFLSVLGFGQGNYRDELAQALAQNGNGVAAYIDTLSEAQKVLVQESTASLFTIAKDVKLQVEFNPLTVAEYRLVGYETRALKREDFNNDAIDAGDVGSGHTVTAIYEITPAGSPARLIEPRRYGGAASNESRGSRDEYGFLKIRYKLPDGEKSRLIERAIPLSTGSLPAQLQRDLRFSTAVAGFAQLLRGGSYTGALKFEDVLREAQAAKGDDPFGYRTEFVQLVRKAEVARGM